MKIKYMEENNNPVYRIELEATKGENIYYCYEESIGRCKQAFIQYLEILFDETVNKHFE